MPLQQGDPGRGPEASFIGTFARPAAVSESRVRINQVDGIRERNGLTIWNLCGFLEAKTIIMRTNHQNDTRYSRGHYFI